MNQPLPKDEGSQGDEPYEYNPSRPYCLKHGLGHWTSDCGQFRTVAVDNVQSDDEFWQFFKSVARYVKDAPDESVDAALENLVSFTASRMTRNSKVRENRAQLKEQLLDEVEKRVIGKDEVYETVHDSPLTRFQQSKYATFNQLRAEQRTALNAMRGGDAD